MFASLVKDIAQRFPNFVVMAGHACKVPHNRFKRLKARLQTKDSLNKDFVEKCRERICPIYTRQIGSPQNLFKQAFAPSIATCQPCHPSHCCLLTGNLANVHWLPPFQHCFSLATSLLLSTSHSALPGLGTRSPGHAKHR